MLLCIMVYALINRMDLAETLAKNMRARRGQMTQRDFARKLGLNQSVIARIESKNENVTLKTLQHLAIALNCKVGELLDE